MSKNISDWCVAGNLIILPDAQFWGNFLACVERSPGEATVIRAAAVFAAFIVGRWWRVSHLILRLKTEFGITCWTEFEL